MRRRSRDAGVTRLSIGAQSFDPALLRGWAGATRPATSRAAVAAARAGGIASVSLDLLYDVPGQTVATWAARSTRRSRSSPTTCPLTR